MSTQHTDWRKQKFTEEHKRKLSLAHKGKNIKHGFSLATGVDKRFYQVYLGMVHRCKTRKEYLGRGIKCLYDTFEQFKADMYQPYLDHVKKYGVFDTQLDRINNDGNYEYGNVRWATRKMQNNNRRGNRTYTLAQICDSFEVDYNHISSKINKYGKSVAESIFRELETHPNRFVSRYIDAERKKIARQLQMTVIMYDREAIDNEYADLRGKIQAFLNTLKEENG